MEFYDRSIAKSETFTYVQQIENFSVRFCRDSYLLNAVTSERKNVGCEWSFTVNFRDEFLGAMLTCDENRLFLLSPLFVKVKLSLIDCFGRSSLYAEKNFQMCGMELHTENVLHLKKDRLLSGNWGLNRLLYLPDDKLTLRWEVTTYEFTNETYDDKKEDFENGFLLLKSLRFLLRFIFLSIPFVVAFAVAVYGLYSLLLGMATFLSAVASAVKEFLLFCHGIVVLALIVGTFVLASRISHIIHNNDQITQIERRQFFMPYNRGVARYETERSMTYRGFRPIGYNNNNRYN